MKRQAKQDPPERIHSGLDTRGNDFNWPYLYFKRIVDYDDFDDPVDGAMFRPLGGQDYGYEKDYQVVSSWFIWLLTTWGSISVDPLEGIGILALSMIAQENDTFKKYFITDAMGTGASWVHNVQAGYCWYHYFIKKHKGLGLMLGTYAELVANLGAVGQEIVEGKPLYSHEAHVKGLVMGMVVARLLDAVRGKNKKFSAKGLTIPTAAVLVMMLKQFTKPTQR
jgi:hypothetical protein